MSGSSGRWTTSAGRPASTARDWSPDEPNEFLNATPSPSGLSANPGSMPSSYAVCGVEYATRSIVPPLPSPPDASLFEPPQAAKPAASPIARTPAMDTLRASPRGRASARRAFAAPLRRSFRLKRFMSGLSF